jgi:hypothetical protein
MNFFFPKISFCILLTLHVVMQSAAQSTISFKQVNTRIDAAQKDIIKLLVKADIDKEGKDLISRFVTFEIDSMQKVIKASTQLNEKEQVQALNCTSYFLEMMKTDIAKNSVNAYQLNEDQNIFIPLWGNIRTDQSCDRIIGELGLQSANIMAAVFKDYPKSSAIKDMALLKSMELTPDKITNFLSVTPGYIYRDSLLYIYANAQPERFIVAAIGTKDSALSNAIHQHRSILVQTLLSIANEKNFRDYLPFVALLAQHKTTLAEIDKARATPSDYYKLIVDAELDNQALVAAGKTAMYRMPLRQYLKEYAIKYFTNVINSLHEEPNEKARYFVLDNLRPQDLYFILVGGENELYTSSYLFTYKKLIGNFPANNFDSLLRLVKYDQYRKFLSMAGRYNNLSAFMKGMSKDTSISLIKRFITGLETREGNGLDETITIAETFPGLVKDNELAALTLREIRNNYNRVKKINNYHGMKLYSLLTDMFAAVKTNAIGNKTGLPPELAVYYNVTHQSLKDADGTINQLVLFYGDDDGKASYSSFLANFSDASQWSIEKNASWITIRSKKQSPIAIYANLPLNNDEGLDLKAQELLKDYLKTNHISPHILIHRGHSYHLANSIKSVTEATRLAILGSCGGYQEIFDVLANSLAVQVISTKQVGSKLVNEPLLKLINETLLLGKDLIWSDIWAQLENQLRSNKLAYDYFQEYVPPFKNIGLLVATLYFLDSPAKLD